VSGLSRGGEDALVDSKRLLNFVEERGEKGGGVPARFRGGEGG